MKWSRSSAGFRLAWALRVRFAKDDCVEEMKETGERCDGKWRDARCSFRQLRAKIGSGGDGTGGSCRSEIRPSHRETLHVFTLAIDGATKQKTKKLDETTTYGKCRCFYKHVQYRHRSADSPCAPPRCAADCMRGSLQVRQRSTQSHELHLTRNRKCVKEETLAVA